MDRRNIDWNGIHFQVPRDWEITRIDRRYLVLESVGAPQMEVKWHAIRGPFRRARYYKRLSDACGASGRFEPMDLPNAWRSALADFTAAAFTWQKGKLQSRGVVLHCRTCRKVCLVQFFGTLAARTDDVARQILATFRDHAEDSVRDWSVFDIRARLPRPYVLKHFCFEAGRYELVWQHKRRMLTLMRWGPAAALLDGRKLAAFAARQLGIAEHRWQPAGGASAKTALQWRRPATRMAVWQLFPAPVRVQAARIWHRPAENRILAAVFKDCKAIEQDDLDTICGSYEAL